MQTQGPPFSLVGAAGERTGSAVELAELMAKEMGVKITFLDFDWDGLIPALLSGKADLLVADMTPTLAAGDEGRLHQALHVHGQRRLHQGRQQVRARPRTARPRAPRSPCCSARPARRKRKAAFPDADIKSYKGGGPLLLDAVNNGQADCGVNDISAVKGQSTAYPAGTFTIMPEMLSKEPLAFATRYD